MKEKAFNTQPSGLVWGILATPPRRLRVQRQKEEVQGAALGF